MFVPDSVGGVSKQDSIRAGIPMDTAVLVLISATFQGRQLGSGSDLDYYGSIPEMDRQLQAQTRQAAAAF